MKKDLFLWQFGGFVFTVVLGPILHFLYDLTNQSVLVAPFSAINESTFEHMKLMYFPMLIFSLIQSRFFKEYKSFWCIKLIGILTGLALIPALSNDKLVSNIAKNITMPSKNHFLFRILLCHAPVLLGEPKPMGDFLTKKQRIHLRHCYVIHSQG